MDTGPGTIIIFFVLIFGSLEITFVVIPALVGSSKVRQPFQPEFEIPYVLSKPVRAEQVARIRSYYFDRSDSHKYIRNISLDRLPPGNPVSDGYPETGASLRRVRPEMPRTGPEPVKDWKAVNRANWAIQRANEAIREANKAITEANSAIEQTGEGEWEWLDQVAEGEQFRLRLEK